MRSPDQQGLADADDGERVSDAHPPYILRAAYRITSSE
jgi:hypothetical protein